MTIQSMDEALEWAADYAQRAKLFEAPLNSRGYPVDGYKPVTPSEKADIILKIARNAMDNGGESPDRKFLRAVLHNLSEARIDAMDESSLTKALSHMESIYKAVRVHLDGR